MSIINDLSLQETWTHGYNSVTTNVETGNGILSNYHLGMGTQQRRQEIK